MKKDFKVVGVRVIDNNGNILFDDKTLDIEKIQEAEFTPENLNIDNDNDLLKLENHNKEFSWTLDLTKAPIDKPTMTKFFKLLCSGMKPPKHIRKKYHSPKRREIEMYRWLHKR